MTCLRRVKLNITKPLDPTNAMYQLIMRFV